MVDWYLSKGAIIPKMWMILRAGEKIKVLKTFRTHNVNTRYGLKGPRNGLSTIKKGSTGMVMGMTSPASLSSTHIAKFGRNYVLVYDYNFHKGELKSLGR